jgi:hypothetical protein
MKGLKGVSAVLAVLLMIIITIALAGIAFGYISGIFTQKTTKQISLVDISCDTVDNPVPAGDERGYYVIVKNLDPLNDINAVSGGDPITIRVDDSTVTTGTWTPTTIGKNGGTSTLYIAATPSVGSAHRILVIGPSNSESGIAFC